MDTSLSIALPGTLGRGIVALSLDEIELVSGGKATEPPKSLWERICNWFSDFLGGGGAAQPSIPSGGLAITSADLVTMQRDCVTAGGSFTATGETSGGGVGFLVVNAWGESSTISIRCVQP